VSATLLVPVTKDAILISGFESLCLGTRPEVRAQSCSSVCSSRRIAGARPAHPPGLWSSNLTDTPVGRCDHYIWDVFSHGPKWSDDTTIFPCHKAFPYHFLTILPPLSIH